MIRVITSLVVACVINSIHAQHHPSNIPKLVVGITIDQLRGDYLQLFQHNFGEKGFKRLLKESLYYQNISFEQTLSPNVAASLGIIYTGASPYLSGIDHNKKYFRDNNSITSVFSDNNFLGNYTQEKLSPLALQSSTIADELKIATNGKADIYSFAANPEEALIGGGKKANGAFWIENTDGQWATTTYYKQLHWIVEQQNRSNQSFRKKIETLAWEPLLSPEAYNTLPYTNHIYNFKHYFNSANEQTFLLAKQTPLANQEIINMAIAFINRAALGKRLHPDMISITLYAGNYPPAKDKIHAIETQDTYLRLDKQIAQLLDEIDHNIGLQNTLIFISPTGYYLNEEPANNPPSTIFYPSRCRSLLNMFLMAEYGHEQWVDTYFNNQIFLNHELINKKKINLTDIQQKAANFVKEFAAVLTATPLCQLPNTPQLQKQINSKTAGDIIIQLKPGTKIEDDNQPSPDYRIRSNAIHAPIFFFGANIKPQKIDRTIDAKEIAPTIAHILRIRSPDAAHMPVLQEFISR